jgi:hypothetical protein
MRRMKLGALATAAAALIVTGIAVADGKKPSNFTSVAAHFTVTGTVKTRTCTSGSVSITEKRGKFTGTSTSSDTRLNGSARITLKSIVSANGFGIATGTFSVQGKARAELVAVVSSTNSLDGFLRGKAGSKQQRRLSARSDDNGNGNRLFANFSATLTGSTLTGDIGSGSHLNTGVTDGGNCEDND